MPDYPLIARIRNKNPTYIIFIIKNIPTVWVDTHEDIAKNG